MVQMVQRSRIAPESDVRSLKKRRGQAPVDLHRIALRNLAALVLLAALICGLPAFFRPDFFSDQARGLMGFAAAAGEWVRAALAAAFNSIPGR